VTTTTSGSSPKITYFVRLFGPVKVKTLPVLASKVLVSECPRALVVLTGNLPSVEYSTVVLLLTIPLPVYDFNASDASSNSPLITVVTSQSNIDNYGNVGTIRVNTTGNNLL
jgi:hypothetical protein